MTWPYREIAALAEAQEGQINHDQLVALGAGLGAIDHSLRSGRIHETFGRVYANGDRALPELWREKGALLACGDGAFISRHWASGLWRFRPAASGDVDVTVPYGLNARRRGVNIHRARRIDPRDVRIHRGIRVSAPAFALLEIALDLSYVEFERAFDDALTLRVMRMWEAEQTLRRHPGRRGAKVYAEFAVPEHGLEITRAWTEQRMKWIAKKGGLPTFVINVRRGRIIPDFVFRDQKVVVEVDGYRTHGTRRAFENDRARDAALAAKGWLVLRFTWRQLKNQPELVLARLAAVLAVRDAQAA